ncbi:hypothetical protein B4U79_10766 [Dinothrombium tinctorium]|uniref:Zinc transporter ZIP14-like protein n=1 Tax=Dinothrombium tinctorium TaxID=1965070 RepID=A0A3S3QEW9_9ACAR|nr:hypothetical protein B4U79_12243 [Dinothrombium tinctorium]RWS08103.1 hypothetical protein B4U79_14946 [Dinothrombium tinctorium]RWS11896.1 hypothetical protein B4U79_10766 [Dinothrombium tinctorium]
MKLFAESVLCLFFVVRCTLEEATATSTPASLASSTIIPETISHQPIIKELDDIEILTYFLLAHHYNYDNVNSDGYENNLDLLATNQTVNEIMIHKFIKDLKEGKINQKLSEDRETSICNETDASFFRDKYFNLDSYRKKRIQDLCIAATSCHSSENLVDLIASPLDEKPSFTQAIVRLCPVILFQLQDQSCTSMREDEKLRPSAGAVWGFAILFVTIISFCSLVGVAIMPFLNKNSYLNVLNLFEGLAVGSLVGSAIFHLIPQAFELLGQVSTDDYLYKALLIFCGIYLFFWSERIMKIMVDFRRKKNLKEAAEAFTSVSDNSDQKANDGNNHHVSFKNSDSNNGEVLIMKKGENVIAKSINGNNNERQLSMTNEKQVNERSHEFPIHNHNHEHYIPTGTSISTVAWMIIFGDGFHNFIDGLSIGAAFSKSILSGISISVAVICEEFPHELGDFAVLIASGMTTRQAVGYNFLSACSCYIGMAFGIIAGDFTEGSTYIFAFAGGMFLYIALVDMMAELSSGLDDALAQSKSQMFKILLLQNVGILLGVCTLFLLAKYSEHINFEGLAAPSTPINK